MSLAQQAAVMKSQRESGTTFFTFFTEKETGGIACVCVTLSQEQTD